jgi:hypothetical protein
VKTTQTTAPRNMGWIAGVASASSLEFREPDLPRGYDDEQRAAFRDGYLEGRAHCPLLLRLLCPSVRFLVLRNGLTTVGARTVIRR